MVPGDPAEARRAAERALDLEPEAVLPRLLLADALIEGGGSGDLQRAAALLEEARERAVDREATIDGSYTWRLLHLDPRVLERLDSKLREALDGSATELAEPLYP